MFYYYRTIVSIAELFYYTTVLLYMRNKLVMIEYLNDPTSREVTNPPFKIVYQ